MDKPSVLLKIEEHLKSYHVDQRLVKTVVIKDDDYSSYCIYMQSTSTYWKESFTYNGTHVLSESLARKGGVVFINN